MAERGTSPYACHIFVCTNDRGGARKSCADGTSALIKAALKQEIARRGWKGRVRVSECGCMGLCEQGPNVIVYPHKGWFSAASAEDVPAIIALVEEILQGSA
jgi:(2Fe-2S) ferredoxin